MQSDNVVEEVGRAKVEGSSSTLESVLTWLWRGGETVTGLTKVEHSVLCNVFLPD